MQHKLSYLADGIVSIIGYATLACFVAGVLSLTYVVMADSSHTNPVIPLILLGLTIKGLFWWVIGFVIAWLIRPDEVAQAPLQRDPRVHDSFRIENLQVEQRDPRLPPPLPAWYTDGKK